MKILYLMYVLFKIYLKRGNVHVCIDYTEASSGSTEHSEILDIIDTRHYVGIHASDVFEEKDGVGF